MQCDKCSAVATGRAAGGRMVFRSLAVEDKTDLDCLEAEKRWRAAETRRDSLVANKALRELRNMRHARPEWVHVDCGGLLRSYDTAATS